MKLLIDIPEHIYEHAKESSEDSRDEFDAMRAIANGTQQESRSEIPNTCGDAVSRAIVQEEITKSIELKENPYQLWYRIRALPTVTLQPCDDAISREAAIRAIEALQLPTVSPQQRTGRWIQKEEEGDAEPFIIWECSECHCVDEDGKPSYKYCPQCGCKMEVEE